MSKRRNIIRKCLLTTRNVQLKVQFAEIVSAYSYSQNFGAAEISSYTVSYGSRSMHFVQLL